MPAPAPRPRCARWPSTSAARPRPTPPGRWRFSPGAAPNGSCAPRDLRALGRRGGGHSRVAVRGVVRAGGRPGRDDRAAHARGRAAGRGRSFAEWVESRLLPLRGLEAEVQRAALARGLARTLRHGALRVQQAAHRCVSAWACSDGLVVRALAASSGVPEDVLAHRLMGTWEPSAEVVRAAGEPRHRRRRLEPPVSVLPGASARGRPGRAWRRARLVGRVEVGRHSRAADQATRAGDALEPRRRAALRAFPRGGDHRRVPPRRHGARRRTARLAGRPAACPSTPCSGASTARPWAASCSPRCRCADRVRLPRARWTRRAQRDRCTSGVPPWTRLVRRCPTARRLHVSPLVPAGSWDDSSPPRATSRARRQAEGLMLKRRTSPYGVGRKVGDWWKWKVDPLTVDAVLIYAQAGHGRRAGLYTDYTFAVWNGDELVPFAKAYSGLTDAEIREVDRFVRANTREKFGPVRTVEPELVFELAFEGIQESARHKSGIAVRFPRMCALAQGQGCGRRDTSIRWRRVRAQRNARDGAHGGEDVGREADGRARPASDDRGSSRRRPRRLMIRAHASRRSSATADGSRSTFSAKYGRPTTRGNRGSFTRPPARARRTRRGWGRCAKRLCRSRSHGAWRRFACSGSRPLRALAADTERALREAGGRARPALDRGIAHRRHQGLRPRPPEGAPAHRARHHAGVAHAAALPGGSRRAVCRPALRDRGRMA